MILCWRRDVEGIWMRGEEDRSGALFSHASLADRVPRDHALRAIRTLVNEALASLSSEFDELYATAGRPSIPQEQLPRAMLPQPFYAIRSERQLAERLNFDLFPGLADCQHLARHGNRILHRAQIHAVRTGTKVVSRCIRGGQRRSPTSHLRHL